MNALNRYSRKSKREKSELFSRKLKLPMATRSRTLLFIQYRNTYSRNTRQRFHDTSENASLIPNENKSSEVLVEMSVLPPKWYFIHELKFKMIGLIL